MTVASLDAWTGRLLETSWQAALLVCAVLVFRVLAGRRISGQWRHALWFVVLLRLLLPWTPQSRYSLYSVVPSPLPKSLTGVAAPMPAPSETPGPNQSGPTAGEVAGAIWLVGAASFLSVLLVQAAGTILAIRGRRPVTDKATLDLLEDCKEEIGVPTYLAVVETPHVRAPALFGWIRPRLLLPEGVLSTLGPDRLRHVFLHELAHLRRHDIAFNWLAALAQGLHWFNPLVWLAFQRARADMEAACDELALACLEEHQSGDYGHTIVDMISARTGPALVPALAAIGEDAAGIKRRIQMIAAFRRGQHNSRLLPAAIFLAMGLVFLVDAREEGPPAGRQPLLGVPIAASVQSSAPAQEAPPIDAAIKSAEDWLGLLDAGDCGATWDVSHSRVRGMVSRTTYVALCRELIRNEQKEHGKPISRKVAQVEYVPSLPMGLGDGVSVGFTTTCEKGRFAGPKLLLAKDADGVWRRVRSDAQ